MVVTVGSSTPMARYQAFNSYSLTLARHAGALTPLAFGAPGESPRAPDVVSRIAMPFSLPSYRLDFCIERVMMGRAASGFSS